MEIFKGSISQNKEFVLKWYLDIHLCMTFIFLDNLKSKSDQNFICFWKSHTRRQASEGLNMHLPEKVIFRGSRTISLRKTSLLFLEFMHSVTWIWTKLKIICRANNENVIFTACSHCGWWGSGVGWKRPVIISQLRIGILKTEFTLTDFESWLSGERVHSG